MKKIRDFIVDHPVQASIILYIIIFIIGIYRNNMEYSYLLLGTFLGVGMIPVMQIIETDEKGKKAKAWAYLFIIVATLLGVFKVGDLMNPPINVTQEGITCEPDIETQYILLDKWNCKGNCKGHEEGYKWACEKFNNAISNDCSGNSESFREGCRSFKKLYFGK